MSKVWLQPCHGDKQGGFLKNHVYLAITPDQDEQNIQAIALIDAETNDPILNAKALLEFWKTKYAFVGTYKNETSAREALGIAFTEIILSGSHCVCPHCMINFLKRITAE